MNRTLKILAILVISLFAFGKGLDKALDHAAHAPTQSSFTVYGEKGNVLLAYKGDLNMCKAFAKPVTIVPRTAFHRS